MNIGNIKQTSHARKDDDKEYIGDVKIVRAGRRKGLTLPGSDVVYELLTPDLNRKLEVMYLRIAKGENSGDEPMSDPLGEKIRSGAERGVRGSCAG